MEILEEIQVFDGEHVERGIGVSKSLEASGGFADLNIKVYLSVENQIN